MKLLVAKLLFVCAAIGYTRLHRLKSNEVARLRAAGGL